MNFLNSVRFLFLLYFCKFNDAGQKLRTLTHPKKPKKLYSHVLVLEWNKVEAGE